MPSDVTIQARPYHPIRFPACCCYCLAPATASAPLRVEILRVRISRTRTTKISYDVQAPYCAAHAQDAVRFARFDRVATIVLLLGVAAALFGIQLALGPGLRELGGLIWFGTLLLLIGGLLLVAALLYVAGRKLYQRRHPAMAHKFYSGGLGLKVDTALVGRPVYGEELMLGLTFTFFNGAFAAQMAALHGAQARAPSQQL